MGGPSLADHTICSPYPRKTRKRLLMSILLHRLLTPGLGLLAAVLCLFPLIANADESISHTRIGTQTVGFAVGPILPIRMMANQSSKVLGTAAISSWSITLTEPIDSSRY